MSIISIRSASFSMAGKPQDAQPGEPLTQRPFINKGAKNINAGKENDGVILDSEVNALLCSACVKEQIEKKNFKSFFPDLFFESHKFPKRCQRSSLVAGHREDRS